MVRKVLCAHDGMEHSDAAVLLAAELAKATGASLTCLAVNTALGGARGPVTMTWDDREADAVAASASRVATQAGASDVKTVIAKGRDPAGAIVHYAFEHGFDHIVVGTGEKGAMKRLVIGSVSADVAAKAHCPVTIAR